MRTGVSTTGGLTRGGDGDGNDGDDPSSPFSRRDAVVEPLERGLTRALKRALSDEQNELLDDLRRAERAPDAKSLLPPLDAHEQRYRNVAEAPLVDAANAGAASVGHTDPIVGSSELAAGLAEDLVGGLRTRVAHALDTDPGDRAAIGDGVSAAYREVKTSLVEPLASHHVLAAYSTAASTHATAALSWVVDPEGGCCPDCADNGLAGPVGNGEAFPAGQHHPPAHSGCRCLMQPLDR